MYKNLNDFFNHLTSELSKADITLKPEWFIDHICYRVDSIKSYNDLKTLFSNKHKFLIETPVGGRNIASFKLSEPISFLKYKIPLLELPEPKLGKNTPEGYEHIEIVCKESFAELQKLYSHLNLETHALNKEINPELIIKLDTITLKFHHQSLEEIIEYEKSMLGS